MLQRPAATIGHLFRDVAGVSAVEFAIIAPVAIVMGLGLASFGFAYSTRLQVEATLNGIQLEAMRGDADHTRAVTQARLQDLAEEIVGLELLGDVDVAEGYGCPDAAASASPVQDGLGGTGSCTCGSDPCDPFRYYVISADMRYALPFGFDVHLPFGATLVALNSIDIAAGRILLVGVGEPE